MKNPIQFLFILAVLITAGASILNAQVKGNGNVIKVSRSISPFDKINISGVLDVVLTQGDAERVTVEADDNLVAYIETKVKDGRLTIDTKEDIEIKISSKMTVYVTLKDLKDLDLSGVGNVRSENQLNLSSLSIDNSAVGDLSLDLNCDKLKAEIKSVGLTTFTGKVGNVSIEHNGVGNVKAFDLSADILKIESNAVGNAEVNSDDEIYIDHNGVGDVSYKGNAVVKYLNVNGVGKVKKM